MTMTADRPEPPQPGAYASSALDKLLLAMRAPADLENETPVDYFGRAMTAHAIGAARVNGLGVHATISALARQLTAVAATLPAAPDPDALAAELAAFGTL